MSGGTQYARPRNLADAASLLDDLGVGASIIAGGQELMPTINHGVFAPAVLVDVNGLPELTKVRDEGDIISIGALCVHREIERHELVKTHAPLLARALATIGGGWQVRNRGTIGGNVVSMHPLYDVLPALLCLQATVQIQSGAETRVDDLAQVIRDSKHGLGTNAILVRVLVNKPVAPLGWGYEKLKATDGAYASANAAALVGLDARSRLTRASLTVGAVEQLPIVLDKAISKLVGEQLTESLLRELERLCAKAVTRPLADQRGDADYRRAMAGLIARRAFNAAAARARAPLTMH